MRPRLLAAGLLFSAAAPAQTSIPALVRTLRDAVAPDRAMEDMRGIWETDRWFTFPKFDQTARNVAAMMRRAGLERVEILQAPADGRSQFGYWTMPMAWDASEASLEILEPKLADDERVLADYRKIPASLGMWSGPTPPEGITAEVVAISGSLEKAAVDVKGKLVLMDRNPASSKWLLVKKGALGAINDFTENAELADGRQWINAWGDAGWAYTRSSTPLLCFSITPRQSRMLRKLVTAGPVRVRARVRSRYYEGTYPSVTGVIRGTQGNEEVLTLGHLFEQGAHDNATGVAAMIGAAETLGGLIRAGKLARPRRSIRVLAMGECYGSMHYLVSNPERVKNTVAAMCVDTPAGPQSLAGTEYTWYLNPHPARSFADALTLRLAAEYFPLVRRPWHWREYGSGTDNYLGDPLIGIPTVWPYSGTGVHSHHNSADTPDTVDARSLRDLVVMTAAYLYYLASAGPAEARAAAELALERAYQQMAAAPAAALERMAAAREAPDLARLFHEALERVDYLLEVETRAVGSARRLGAVEELAGPLAGFAGQQKRRVERAVQARAAALGLGQIRPLAPPVDPRAAALVVRRKRAGTITLDDLPVEERQGFPAASFSGPPVTALYWCDGRRTLAEVIRRTKIEAGPVDFDFVGYFEFLAQRGYVELTR